MSKKTNTTKSLVKPSVKSSFVSSLMKLFSYDEDSDEVKKSTIKVQILKSVAGTFRLSYSVGEKVKIPKKQAEELIEKGFAIKTR